MPLLECSDCHGKVSDKAKACPHCGNPDLAQVRAPVEPPRPPPLDVSFTAPKPPSKVGRVVALWVVALLVVGAGYALLTSGAPEGTLVAARVGLLIAGSLAVYFIPTMVALSRGHHQSTAIVMLNILLGWTLLGWVIAIVWAVSATQPKQAAQGDED